MRHSGADDHVHGAVDATLLSSDRGIAAVKWSFLLLAATTIFQVLVFLVSGSVGLLADTIHNFGDAATAIPLWIAFRLSRRAPVITVDSDTTVPRLSKTIPKINVREKTRRLEGQVGRFERRVDRLIEKDSAAGKLCVAAIEIRAEGRRKRNVDRSLVNLLDRYAVSNIS